MTQLCSKLQSERDVDEARLAREHVTGLCSVTCDEDRSATIARDRATRHRGHRGLEDHRRYREWNARKTVRVCGGLEAVMQLLLGRCLDPRVDEQRGACRRLGRRLQQRRACRLGEASDRKLDADPACDVATHREHASDHLARWQLDLAMTTQERGGQRTSGTGRDNHERCAGGRTVGARQRCEASVAAHALDVATIDDASAELQSTLEQGLLKTTDRNESHGRLSRERGQISDALGLVADDTHLAGNRTAGDEITFATRREQRHDLWIADVDAQCIEICEVTLASHEQLRTQTRVELRWWAAVDDENCKLEACKLDRQCQTHRTGADDRYVELLREVELSHGTRPSPSAEVEVVVLVGMYMRLLSELAAVDLHRKSSRERPHLEPDGPRRQSRIFTAHATCRRRTRLRSATE